MNRFIYASFFVGVLFTSCTRVSHEPVDPNGIVYEIPFIENVTIDGSSDDWNNAGFSARLFANHLGEFVPESDLSARFSLAWNKEGLLIFAVVHDDTICEADEGTPLFNADCIEMFIANRRDGTDAVQFVVAPGVDNRFPQIRMMTFDRRRTKELQKHDLDIRTAVQKTRDAYSFEALIPFNLLLITPEVEEEFAFQIYVNDRDHTEQNNPHSVKWYHRHGAHGFLSAFNRIVLSEDATSVPGISVKCNVIDEEFLRFYLIGNKGYAGRVATIDMGEGDHLDVALQRKKDYAFALVETAYPSDSLQGLAVIRVDGELVDVINLEEAWRIYLNTKAPNPWTRDIEQFERMDRENPPPQNAILFIGDSNIRLWTMLEEDMDGLTVINRGFGGSQSGDLPLYADRIILPYRPKTIVVGSGNNDVNAGVATDITVSNYHELIILVHEALPETRMFLLSTKPSPGAPEKIPIKGALNPEIEKIAAQYDFVEYINVFDPLYDKDGHLSDDLYIYDRGHLNENGYAIWTPIIKEQILKNEK